MSAKPDSVQSMAALVIGRCAVRGLVVASLTHPDMQEVNWWGTHVCPANPEDVLPML